MSGTWRVTPREELPGSRLTRLAGVAVQAIGSDPEHKEGDRFIILGLSEEDKEGGAGILGYEMGDALGPAADMIIHINTMLASEGMHMVLVRPEEASPN